MSKLPISVFIITQDEEDRLPLAIKSVKDWVEEVIVVDSGSTDNTVAIANALGAKTIFNKWQGYGPQKVFAETLCKNTWLLNIDADEEISPDLAKEIQDEFKDQEPKYKAYEFIIKFVNRFDTTPGRFAPAHIQTRLYNKILYGFKDSTVHDSVVCKEGVKEQIYRFKSPVLHRSFRSYSHAIAKINRYSSMQAADMVKRGRNPSIFRIMSEPFIAFLKGYFIKRHCFLGVEGFIEGILYSFARTLRLAKARELWKEIHHKQGKT